MGGGGRPAGGVFFRGTGLGIPIYNIARLWDCYEKCAKDQVMSWDQGPELYRPAHEVGAGGQSWRRSAFWSRPQNFW